MNVFPTRPLLSALSAAEVKAAKSAVQLYQLEREFRYNSELAGTVVVPQGFVTDFASIPRGVWTLIDPEDTCILYGSIVHDYLYAIGGKLSSKKLERVDADKVLREAMNYCGAGVALQDAVYDAVRIFGGSHWAK